MSVIAPSASSLLFAGRYEIVRPLAMGGMAELLVARLRGPGGFSKLVVIKRLLSHYAEDDRVARMLLDEARIAGALQHPNVASVIDAGLFDGAPFLVMELIDGCDLSTLCVRGLERGLFPPLGVACLLVSEIADALAYVHGRLDLEGRPLGIVHRDLSPSNIMVGWDGHARLVDFGIARDEASRERADGLRPGKYSYMAPEQARGQSVDARADLFSLGVVLYEITVGRRLFKGRPEEAMIKIVEGTIPPPTAVRRDYPPLLEQVVLRALERDPRERFPTASALRDALGEAIASLGAARRDVDGYLRSVVMRDDARLDGEPPAAGEADAWRTAARDFADKEESLRLERGLRLPSPSEAQAFETLAAAATAAERPPDEGEQIGGALLALLAEADAAADPASADSAGREVAVVASEVESASGLIAMVRLQEGGGEGDPDYDELLVEREERRRAERRYAEGRSGQGGRRSGDRSPASGSEGDLPRDGEGEGSDR